MTTAHHTCAVYCMMIVPIEFFRTTVHKVYTSTEITEPWSLIWWSHSRGTINHTTIMSYNKYSYRAYCIENGYMYYNCPLIPSYMLISIQSYSFTNIKGSFRNPRWSLLFASLESRYTQIPISVHGLPMLVTELAMMQISYRLRWKSGLNTWTGK